MRLKELSILVVDDDEHVRIALTLLLKKRVYSVNAIESPDQIQNILTNNSIDVILLDMNFRGSVNTGNEGLFWLKRIKEISPEVDIILITAFGDISLAVRAMKEGAGDFIVKPWDNDYLISVIENIADLRKNRNKIKPESNTSSFSNERNIYIGESPGLKKAFQMAQNVATTDANVLICGDNGTGKDILAEYIHLNSARKNKKFVRIDVGAIPESLFESELFGFKKGAFTDAKENKAGRLDEAEGGTLFLDEIANLSLPQQAKLLTLIQQRLYTPLGSSATRPCNFRLICATNAPINKLVYENLFRQDLYYRIRTIEIYIPSLIDRPDDIVPLIKYFLSMYNVKYHKSLTISESALILLQEHNWPGNIRELKHCVERSVILCDADCIEKEHFDIGSHAYKEVRNQTLNLDEIESEAISNALSIHNGNISAAAKALGITRASLYRRIEKYGI